MPEVAEVVAGLLRAGEEDDALRFLLDGLLRVAELDRAEDIALFLTAPAPVGDVRWDTLIAAATAHLCRRRALPPPAWTRRDSLPRWWWPGHVHARRAQALQRTPIDLRRVGIWLDERNFTVA